jgi:NAD(P)H-dependent FMN reductase
MSPDPLCIAVVVGSTRPGRHAVAVAEWVLRHGSSRDDARFELVDLADHDLPFFDEPRSPLAGDDVHDHTRRWAATIAAFDGFVFVAPEYNHAAPAVLKNAIDFLFAEWNDKAAGFVTYGAAPGDGVRAAEHLRLVLTDLKVATVRGQVSLAVRADWTDRDDSATFRPRDLHHRHLETMLREVVEWSGALRPVRRLRERAEDLTTSGS